ncbi:phytoene desaturase family protein [Streptomyces hiroshimensis]|uniref:Dehydrogenase n=1 Tax=Streptomyces hiroshimensis TaxID=66424 RepID=A0ABQ2Z9D1_9ACTN|nr:FAD-dependent oxidoreductase [Streptomyces hiroshimensis]GGY05582.1 dehydrogenase [Streptomyces hiroshimensis]
MNAPGERADAVVVGAGLAGLAAAVRLASTTGPGRRILLLEAGAGPGGRARTTAFRGHRLDLGPRALYPAAERQLRALGIRITGGTPGLARAGALRDGTLHPGYAAPGALLRTPLLSPRERLAVARLLALCRSRSDPRRAGTDAAQWLADRLPSARARQAAFALLRISAYVGSPGAVAADALAAHFAGARRGVRYVDGGWGSVVAALAARAAELGVHLRTGARAVAVEGGTAPCVHLADGSETGARAVIVAGPPPRTAAALLGLPALAAHAGPPLRTACLAVALRRPPEPLRPLVFGVDEPVYFSDFSVTARLAPPGGSVLHLARYDDGTAPGPARVREQLYALLDRCRPGWRDALVHERFLPGITTMSAVPAARTGGLAGRPGVRAADRPGVFLAGDWVGPAGLLADASVLSGVAAADAAAARL